MTTGKNKHQCLSLFVPYTDCPVSVYIIKTSKTLTVIVVKLFPWPNMKNTLLFTILSTI